MDTATGPQGEDTTDFVAPPPPQGRETGLPDQTPAALLQPQTGFTVPPGYKLIPEEVYHMLVSQSQRPVATVSSATLEERPTRGRSTRKMPTIYLEVLRPIHLGDIKTNINPGEEVEFIPTQSITIRGKEHKDLGSFLNIWNSQWPGSPRYNKHFEPVFHVKEEQMDELIAAIGAPRNANTRRRGSTLEGDRIRREEGDPRAATARRAARVDGVEFADTDDDGYEDEYVDPDALPPQGSEERREMIEQACLGVRPRPGHEQDGVESPEDFGVTRRATDYRTVARVPGKPADEGKRRQRRERR